MTSEGIRQDQRGDGLRGSIVESWCTNHRVTVFLFEHFPAEPWDARIPGAPRRKVRMIAGHLHNCRCMWVKMLGEKAGIEVPEKVDRYRVTRSGLIQALGRSHRAVVRLIELAFEHDGRLPGASWSNLPRDVVQLVAYLIAHEGHHRGQLVMLARQLGHRLPDEVAYGLWQWSRRAQEARTEENRPGAPESPR